MEENKEDVDEEMKEVVGGGDGGRQFKCVICGVKDESTESKPIGMIVLMQPSTG